jgi:hypothetical protein
MPAPEIPHSIPAILDRFAIDFGCDVALSPPQKTRPNPIRANHLFKLNPLTFPDPEPAVDDEPRRS